MTGSGDIVARSNGWDLLHAYVPKCAIRDDDLVKMIEYILNPRNFSITIWWFSLDLALEKQFIFNLDRNFEPKEHNLTLTP